LDAQPDFNPGWSEGTLRSTNGFDSISVYATSAVESLFGVGGQNGEGTLLYMRRYQESSNAMFV
jgi:hypothetical protein